MALQGEIKGIALGGKMFKDKRRAKGVDTLESAKR